MKDYIEIQLKELFDEKSECFSKIMDILNNPNPKNRDYVEIHHIIPKSLNKSLKDDKNNMIALSSYNHTMIHYYYYKCAKTNYLKSKMFPMFLIVKKKNHKVARIDSWTEEEAQSIARAVEDVRENTISLKRPFICLETGKIYKCRELCLYELNAKNINKVLSNKITKCHGYHFVYCDDERLGRISHKEIIKEIEREARIRRKERRKDAFTDEWKDKISKAHSGKEFVCLEDDKTFTNQAECSKRYGILRSELSNMLNKNEYRKTNKFHFIYTEKKGNRTNSECLRDIQKYVLEHDGNLNRYNAKKVICYETSIVYKSTNEACRETGIVGIANCCLHNSSSAGGYHWFFLDEDIDRVQYVKEHPVRVINNKVVCLETKEVFNSVKEAGCKYKCSKSSIILACNEKSRTCKGYHFLYEKDYLQKTEKELQKILLKKNSDAIKQKKAVYKKLIQAGKWSPKNNGWNRFQSHYKELVNLGVI